MSHHEADDRALAQLMRAAQAGDTRAYAELLRTITPRVRRFVCSRRRSVSGEECEDIVQDVLLSLHAVRATYDPGRPFVPWLMAIARNRLADAGRRYARRAALDVKAEMSAVTFSDEAANTGSEEYRNPDELRQAIAGLPRGQREAVEMLKLREMSLKEAAAASGTSIGALKVSVHRAMGALRKALIKE